MVPFRTRLQRPTGIVRCSRCRFESISFFFCSSLAYKLSYVLAFLSRAIATEAHTRRASASRSESRINLDNRMGSLRLVRNRPKASWFVRSFSLLVAGSVEIVLCCDGQRLCRRICRTPKGNGYHLLRFPAAHGQRDLPTTVDYLSRDGFCNRPRSEQENHETSDESPCERIALCSRLKVCD